MTAPQPVQATDAATTSLLLRLAEQAEAIAGEAREAAGEPTSGNPAWNRAYTAGAKAAHERLAAEIRAQKQDCPEPSHNFLAKPSCWYCGRNGAFERAAKIAEGNWP